MKNKMLKATRYTTLLLLMVIIGYSCSDDPVQDFVQTEWNVEPFTVKASEWSWNPTLLRWEAVKQLKFIDEFIYESGAVIGFFFTIENGKEVQYQLPHDVNLVIGEEKLTETLDYYYDFKTKQATFLIKPSDSIEDPEAKQTYDFRIVMIW